MPIYEYECPECVVDFKPHRFEEIRAMADSGKPVMCACGAMARRLMSTSSFAMKPTGKGMALDSLNTKDGGMPNGSKRAWAQQQAGAGL